MARREIYCNHCKKKLGVMSFKLFETILYEKSASGGKKPFCDYKCYSEHWDEHVAETYNGQKIYKIKYNDEIRYIPYPECHYYFTTIEDCRKRIDTEGISLPW